MLHTLMLQTFLFATLLYASRGGDEIHRQGKGTAVNTEPA